MTATDSAGGVSAPGFSAKFDALNDAPVFAGTSLDGSVPPQTCAEVLAGTAAAGVSTDLGGLVSLEFDMFDSTDDISEIAIEYVLGIATQSSRVSRFNANAFCDSARCQGASCCT